MPAQANERIITDDTAKEIIEALKNIPGVTGATTIDHGGTGATNKEDALRNLGAQPLIGVNVEEELGKMVKSVNSITPDANGDVHIAHVKTAENLTSDDAQDIYGEFIERTTGGTASLTDGKSWIGLMEGNSILSGHVDEQKSVQVTNVSRVPISAAINWTNFRIAVNFLSTNKIFSYNGTAWSEDPEDYGITVTGYPIVGDAITASLVAKSESFNFVSDNPNLQVNINWATYEAAYETEPVTFFSYASGEWSSDMAAYGFTITGNPSDGDVINVSYTPEVHNMYVNPATRGEPVVAYVNWDTFKSAVSDQETTLNITYTTDWSETLVNYGISISGGPIRGDQITVYFTPEVLGHITNATPTGFVSMNWNLYRHSEGVARVLKYHPIYGFKIEGTYTGLTFSATLEGEQSAISVDSEGNFQIPSDGYVFVTGGHSNDTAIYMTWSDWTEGCPLEFAEHYQSTIDLASLMQANFPYGLCAVGSVSDDIDFASNIATRRIDRLANTAVNLEIVKASGREYAYDADYIYTVLETPISVGFSHINYELDAWDHGIEWVVGTTVPVFIHMLYGQNLRDKLRTDVVTISAQSLTSAQKQQIRQNLGLGGSAELPIANGGTGATDAAGARTALGLGSAAVKNLASSIVNTDTGLPTAALVSQAVDALNGKIQFYGTLGADVLATAKGMPDNQIRIYKNSNQPTNRPTNGDWGMYVFRKSDGVCRISYYDSNMECYTSAGITNSSTEISWKQLALDNNPLFGRIKHFKYTKSSNSEISLDTVLDEYPVTTDTTTIGVDVQGTIANCGGANRSFVLSWRNGGNTYCWALVMNFSGIYYAMRLGTSTYTITKLN